MAAETLETQDENVPAADQDDEPDMTYTKELRAATKDVHKISDLLVNAKFALALSNDEVWYDALLCFYEVYKYLEQYLPEDLLPKDLQRTASFEKDLAYFYGENWKDSYEPRESVRKYLEHLENVRQRGDLYLFAYAYQMYMALMSGGQLLQKKRMIARKLWIGKSDDVDSQVASDPDDLQTRPMPMQVTICPEGCAATYFPIKIKLLKNRLRNILNKHYGQMSEEVRAAFIEESRSVFLFNGDVVRSVKGTNRANMRKLAIVLVFVVGVYFALKLAKR